MSRKWLVVCSVAVMLLVSGCAPAKAPSEAVGTAGYKSIRIVGSTLGSTMSTAAMVYATVLTKYYREIEWSSSGGVSSATPVYLTKGEIRLAIVVPGGYIASYGFDKIPESRLRSISVPTPAMWFCFAIPQDRPWTDITQVPKGSSLCPGGAGTPQIGLWEAWLNLAGLSRKDFNWLPMGRAEQVDAWREGKLDLAAIAPAGTAPYLIEMDNSPRRFKAMGLSPQQAAKATAEKAFERLGYAAPSKSNLTQLAPELFKFDVVSSRASSFLVCRDDFPEQIAYQMAKVFDEHRAEMTQIFSPMKYGTPQYHMEEAGPPYEIHSGVLKYYKEKGYLK